MSGRKVPEPFLLHSLIISPTQVHNEFGTQQGDEPGDPGPLSGVLENKIQPSKI